MVETKIQPGYSVSLRFILTSIWFQKIIYYVKPEQVPNSNSIIDLIKHEYNEIEMLNYV